MSELSRYCPGAGNPEARLMLVGDYPGSEEVNAADPIPFIGQEGEEVRRLISENGASWPDLYTTNVYKYKPPVSYKKGVKVEQWPKWEQCYAQLWEEIEHVNPNAIITFGALSFETLTGKYKLSDHRGSILRTARQVNRRFIKVVPTIHPINYLKPKGEGGVAFQARAYVLSDVEKGIIESRSPDFDLPQRTLKIITDSAELDNFIESNWERGLRRCATDIETGKVCIPVCVSLAFSPHLAVSVPLAKIVSKAQERERARMWLSVARLYQRKGLQLIMQHGQFDHDKLFIPGLDIPYEAVYADTLMLHHWLYPEFPKSLAFICSVHLREPYYKDEGKGFDHTDDTQVKRYLEYNAKDSAVEFEVFLTLLAQMQAIDQEEGTRLETIFFDYVMKLHTFYMKMERVGFRVDNKKRGEQYKKYALRLHDLAKKFENRFGFVLNPNANNKNGQVWNFVFEKLHLPQRDGLDDEILSALYGNHCNTEDKKFGVNYILDSRRIRKHLSTSVEAYPDYDGRLKTSYNICGTETGRSSTGVLKSPLRREQNGASFHSIPHHSEFGDFQECMIADEGDIIGVADLSQSQARIVAALARDEELLNAFDTSDVHWWTAGIALDFDSERIKCPAKDDPRRFLGKMTRHGTNFDMRKRAAADHINQNIKRFGIPIDMISEWKAGEMLDRVHRRSPKTRGVFHREIVEALERNKRILYTAYGRRRQFYDRWGHELWKEAFAYIPQADEIDHLRQAALRAEKRCPTIRWCMEHHDALKWFSRREEFIEHASVIKEEMDKLLDFSRCSLPREPLKIPAEVEYGLNLGAYSEKNPLGMRKFRGKVEL